MKFNKATHMTYFDFAKHLDEMAHIYSKSAERWQDFYMESMDHVLDSIATKTLKAATQSFLDSVKKMGELTEKNGDELMEYFTTVASAAYSCGYSEGSHHAMQEACDNLKELFEERKIDESGVAAKILDMVKSLEDKEFHELHKGENLTIMFDDEEKTGQKFKKDI